MVQGGVFINYRGADSGSYGALLYSELPGGIPAPTGLTPGR